MTNAIPHGPYTDADLGPWCRNCNMEPIWVECTGCGGIGYNDENGKACAWCVGDGGWFECGCGDDSGGSPNTSGDS